ncbi:MAG: hypothetical protein R3B06_12550 [Kofleriaceae bacterium]
MSQVLSMSASELRVLHETPLGDDFSWSALGEAAAIAAASAPDLEPDRRVALAEVALLALRKSSRQGADGTGLLLSEVVLRAGLVARFGHVVDTPHDGNELMRILEHEIASAEPLRAKLGDGPLNIVDEPISVVRVLRRVKNLLRSAEPALPLLPLPPVLSWWWERRHLLP